MTYQIISKHRGKLMGVAALWIYVFHMLPAPAFADAHGLDKVWWYIRNAGFCGVDMFLFVSGLGLAYHLHRHPVRDWKDYLTFLKQRFFRIYVTFLPFTVIYGLLDSWGIGMFLKRLLCLDQFGGNLYNFCWYVCCILLMYLLTPLFYSVSKRPVLTAILGVGYLCALFAAKPFFRSDLYAIAVRVPVFVLGLQAARFSQEERRIGAGDWMLCAGMVLVGFVLSYGLNSLLIPSPLPACNALVNVLLAPGLCLMLSALFELLDRGAWFKPAGKVLTFFGTISFELYLLQEWYVRRGLHVLPGGRKLYYLFTFCVMVALSAALWKISGLLRSLVKKA